MRGLKQLFVTNFKLFLREPIGTFFTLAFPSLLIVLFGAMYGNEPSDLFGGYGSMDISIPGYTALILGTVGFMSVPIVLSGYRETGVLRRYQASALRPLTYIIADVFANLIMTLIGMAILVLVGWMLHKVRFEGNPFQLFLGVILCGLAMFSAGYLIASVARGARTAQIMGMIIIYPMMFLSGAGMPIELLPESIRRISDFLPLTYVVRLLRGLWFGASWSDHLMEVAVLTGIIIVCTALATRFFKWE